MVPLLILLSGVAVFFLVPLDLPLRVFLLVSEVVAAGVVAVVLRRRFPS